MRNLKKLVLTFSLLLLLIGCQEEPVTDAVTQPSLSTVKAEPGNLIMRFRNDGMAGHADYLTQELVIDPGYYSKNDLRRGDVVYLSYPEHLIQNNPNIGKTNILRVIALEGETVEIRKSHVYINGNKLETFYSKPPGPDLEELKKQESYNDKILENELNNNQRRIRNYERMNMQVMLVPQGSVFLLGDNRGRAADSFSIGTIPIDHIGGKVMGHLDKHAWEVSSTFTVSMPNSTGSVSPLKLRGEKDKLAIVDQPIIARKPYQNYWFFWGKPEELDGIPQIIGVRQGNELNRRVVFAAGGMSGPITGTSDGHIPPSNMIIPEPGLWRLEAYIGDQYFGSLVVNVQVNSTDPAPWKLPR
ncbi:MAG: signal peptidase [Paenibacillus sp.]|nr:signal peptidase [Paenibacillus sp.]